LYSKIAKTSLIERAENEQNEDFGDSRGGVCRMTAFGAARGMRPIPTGVKQGKAENLYKPAKEFYDEKEQVDAVRRV